MKTLYIFILILLTSCTEKSERLIANSSGEVYIAIIENYSKQVVSLTNAEVKKINLILPKAVKKMNYDTEQMLTKIDDGSATGYNLIVNLKDYKRQYCPYINDLGQKEVYVNCFCETHNSDYWKTKIVGVDGGGKCYFQGIINLKTGKFRDFQINAPL